jgi:hypothetical protein
MLIADHDAARRMADAGSRRDQWIAGADKIGEAAGSGHDPVSQA